MAARRAPVYRTGAVRGTHVRALFSALLELEELVPDGAPSWRRVAIRDHRAALVRAYPELKLETDLANYVADLEDEDGVA